MVHFKGALTGAGPFVDPLCQYLCRFIVSNVAGACGIEMFKSLVQMFHVGVAHRHDFFTAHLARCVLKWYFFQERFKVFLVPCDWSFQRLVDTVFDYQRGVFLIVWRCGGGGGGPTVLQYLQQTVFVRL